MTDEKRDELRALQDRWLSVPSVASHLRNYPDGERIVPGGPTFRDVRDTVLPAWETWFREFLEGVSK